MAHRSRRAVRGQGILGQYYNVGKLLGAGAFGQCYEVTDRRTGYMYACKQIRKSIDSYSLKRLKEEITILSKLKHSNIVGYVSYFMENNVVCIILDLCNQQTMYTLLIRRRKLTEPEIRYYLRQIINGVGYLHCNHVVHRDLKPDNILLDNMQVKIGDFGLSAIQRSPDQVQWTLIGTPSYTAPEVYAGTGYSYKVDVWAIGCIVYTLLMGICPFQSASREEVRYHIKTCSYVPPTGSRGANKFINYTLQLNPNSRPVVNELLSSEFLNTGYTPSELPVSCLTVCPRFVLPAVVAAAAQGPSKTLAGNGYAECKTGLRSLISQMLKMFKSNPTRKGQWEYGDEYTCPSADPVVWVIKFYDFTKTYGFVYQLLDKSIGILFNDDTKLTMMRDECDVHYITSRGTEYYYTLQQYPPSLTTKMAWLNQLRSKISRGRALAHQGNESESSTLRRFTHIYRFYRVPEGVLFLLSNGTVQVAYNDSSALLCPCMRAATLIFDKPLSLQTYSFTELQQYGCSRTLYSYLKLAYEQLATVYQKT